MDVLKIIVMMALAIYLIRKDVFISRFKFKLGFKGMEVDISTKEKNGAPSQADRSNLD